MSGETQTLTLMADKDSTTERTLPKKSFSNRRTRSPKNRRSISKTNSMGTGANGGPLLSRRHTTQEAGTSRPSRSRKDHSNSPNQTSRSLRRTISTGSGANQRLHLHRRRTSMGSGGSALMDSLVDKSGDIWNNCPATVSSISKPSLMEKLTLDEQFRVPCPLPSIMGDSVEESHTSKGEKVEEDGKEDDTEQALISDTEQEEEEDTEHDNTGIPKGYKLKGFFQFDPSKEDNLKIVRAASEEDVSIFPMQDRPAVEEGKVEEDPTITTTTTVTTETAASTTTAATKLDGFVQFDPAGEDNLKVVRAASGDASIFPMQDTTTPTTTTTTTTEQKEVKTGDGLEEQLKEMDDSHDDLPPLVDEEQTEAEDINSLFSATWSGGFTLHTDNPRGHADDLVDNPEKECSQSEAEIEEEEEEEEEEYSEEEEEEETEEQSLEEEYDDNDSESSQGSEEETVLDDPRDSNASRALIQFNHTTPDAIDFAACTDDATIFRMDSNGTLDIPAVRTSDGSELDKKLKVVSGKSAGKEKRNSMFAGKLLEKAKSFKRPRAASIMEKAQSFRVPNKGKQGLDITDHASNNKTTKESKIQSAPNSDNEKREGSVNGGSNHSLGSSSQKDDQERKHDKKDEPSFARSGTDTSVPRRRRERIKGRRESVRDKATDTQDEERKERLRKREALRKATSGRNVTGDGLSPKMRVNARRRSTKTGVEVGNSSVPNLETDRVGRRSTKMGDMGNSSVPHLESDRVGLDREGNKTPSSQEGKERRRTIRKSNSSRNLTPGRASASASNLGAKRSLRRTHSSDDGGIRRSSANTNRRRTSERPSSGRARKEGKNELDSSRDKGDEKGKSGRPRRDRESEALDRGSQKGDERRQRRRSVERRKSRRRRESEGREDDMDRSKDSQNGTKERRRSGRRREGEDDMDRSKDSQGGTKERRRSGRRRESEDDMDKSKESQNGTRERRHSGGDNKKHLRRSRRSRDSEHAGEAIDSSGADVEDGRRVGSDHANTDNGASARLGNSFSGMDLDDNQEEKGREKVTASSSLRVERSFDGSFSELAAAHEKANVLVSETFHNDLETFHNDLGAGETDRRKSFIKSLSVRIGHKQSTIGKGARNLIIGGSRAEKRRLLDMDDESVLS